MFHLYQPHLNILNFFNKLSKKHGADSLLTNVLDGQVNKYDYYKDLQNMQIDISYQNQDVDSIDRKIDCFNGYYLGNVRKKVNCNKICYKPEDSDAKFYYRWFNEPSNEFNVGGYCMEKSFSECNTKINRYIFNIKLGTFQCIPRFPELLGGEFGNRIIGCNGSFVDLKTKTEYHHSVPSTMEIKDINETFKGDFRYQCTKKIDEMGNPLITPFPNSLRFFQTRNVCASMIFGASKDIKLDAKNGACVFEDVESYPDLFEHFKKNPTYPINACLSGWQKGNVTADNGAYKYSFGINIPCIGKYTPKKLWPIIKYPCNEFNEARKIYCHKANLMATTNYSPLALTYITKK